MVVVLGLEGVEDGVETDMEGVEGLEAAVEEILGCIVCHYLDAHAMYWQRRFMSHAQTIRHKFQRLE